MNQADNRSLATAVSSALAHACNNLARRQADDGSWRGDYSGPAFLLPMYVGLHHISGQAVPAERAKKMRTHLHRALNPDGSIGLYIGGPGCVFTSCLGYVALRLLGEPPSDPAVTRLREWIHAHGSPLESASWGKFALCTLGLYEYDGLHPVAPELWLLPYRAPIHPGRLWCHARHVYLPMAWLYRRRAVGPITPLIRELRDELYGGRYGDIRWSSHRSRVNAADDYRPLTPEYKASATLIRRLSAVAPVSLSARALDEVMAHIRYEADTTENIHLGPVNAVLNTLVHHFDSPGGTYFTKGIRALDAYLWEAGDELRMQGYNSSQLWDTAFAMQALHAARAVLETGATDVGDTALRRAYRYVRDNQMPDDPPEYQRYYRHRTRGAWPFSNSAQGWPTTDCTAEGLKAALIGAELDLGEPIGDARLRDAVRLILSWQNDDGGWATYERSRGGRWLERLNPSQVFGDIMIEYSHVECTSACIQALAEVRHRLPSTLDSEVQDAINSGVRFLTRVQRADGSFEGFWGVCFTYGTWFGVSGLLAAGVPLGDKRIRRAAEFLRSVQKEDGSWGESPRSCPERTYIYHAQGQVVMTAWAVLALCRAGYARHHTTEAGVRFLLERQRPDGGYPAESYAGVFSRTTMINYDNYRHYFPLWALATWLGHLTRLDGIRRERKAVR